MARSRVYHHDVRCSQCGSNWMRKDARREAGLPCGDCGRRGLSPPGPEVKELALAM